MEHLKVALCQMEVTDDKKKNLAKAEAFIRRAVAEGEAKLVVLPEMFNCPYDNRCFPVYAEEYPGESTNFLGNLAKELGIYIVGGSIPEADQGKYYNTAYVFDDQGKMIARHRKMHLFDIDVPGGITFKESEILGAGNQVTVFPTPWGTMGLAICYDMRFPELMRLMALKGAKAIIVPAAFNLTTGPAHWHETIKVRALDNQVYFLAASPARNMKASYHAYGYSSILNPWGEVLSSAGPGEEIVYGVLDAGYVERIRNQLPLLKHRREDCYSLEEGKASK